MPKVTITYTRGDTDTGLEEFGFMIDGKRYKVKPKPNSYNELENFFRLVKKSEKGNLNPFVYGKKDRLEIIRENPNSGQKTPQKKSPKDPKPDAEQMNLFKSSSCLDSIATQLEKLGHKDIAYKIDILANTVDDTALKYVKISDFWDEINNQEIDKEDAIKILEAFNRGADTEYSVAQVAKVDALTTKKVLDISEKNGIIEAINKGKWNNLKKKLEK